VKKGSLCETALLQAKLEAAQRGSLSEADRKKARRAANRLAAFQSRQRRKEIIADLQVSECLQLKALFPHSHYELTNPL
jgi:hypothetical protein